MQLRNGSWHDESEVIWTSEDVAGFVARVYYHEGRDITIIVNDIDFGIAFDEDEAIDIAREALEFMVQTDGKGYGA